MRTTDLIDAIGQLSEEDVFNAKAIKSTGKQKPPVRLLLCAAVMLLACVLIGAGVFTLHDRARADLGIEGQEMEEYTEFDISAPAKDTSVELVSTLCTGNQLIAYLQVSPVSEEMYEEVESGVQENGRIAAWMHGTSEPHGDANVYTISQISFDSTTQSALLKVVLTDSELMNFDSVNVEIVYYVEENQKGQVILSEKVDIPVTKSSELTAIVDETVQNPEVELAGTITDFSVCAGYLSFSMKVMPFADYYEEYLGASGTELLTVDEEFTAMEDYFHPWHLSVNQLQIELIYQDGTAVDVTNLQSKYEFAWNVMDDDPHVALKKGVISFELVLDSPILLDDVKAVSIQGDVYELE